MPSILTLPGKIVNRGGTFFPQQQQEVRNQAHPPAPPVGGERPLKAGQGPQRSRDHSGGTRYAKAARLLPADCQRGGLTKGQIGAKL